HLMAELRQLRRATHPGRPAANHRDALSGFLESWLENRDAVLINMIRRVALEPADLDRVAVAIEHHARALAQHFGRANPRAARAQDVGREDGPGCAGKIAGHDLLDEC